MGWGLGEGRLELALLPSGEGEGMRGWEGWDGGEKVAHLEAVHPHLNPPPSRGGNLFCDTVQLTVEPVKISHGITRNDTDKSPTRLMSPL